MHTPLGRVIPLPLALPNLVWALFFLRGNGESLLCESLLGTPVYLALAPNLYSLAFAVLTRSIGFDLAIGIFGVVHISLSR